VHAVLGGHIVLREQKLRTAMLDETNSNNYDDPSNDQ
jgi:hypothetical protein